MDFCGVHVIVYELIKDYLSNRTQQVWFDDKITKRKIPKGNILQRTVTDPLLFLHYVSELVKTDFTGKIVYFVDKTAIVFSRNE